MTPAQRRAAARKAAADAAAEPVEVADAKLTPAQRRGAARKAAAEEADKPLTPAEKRAAARKALADKKADAEKKELADKAAADKKASRSNPSRIWVQVAGGANESDLTKAWSGVKAKSPALAARAGYSTPLRATNRVLTGPFKTDSEARAFVNQLSKQGVSAFPFTSDAGQPVTRLGGK
nr:SPOR domain-containing protein [Sphingomonas sp. BT552]